VASDSELGKELICLKNVQLVFDNYKKDYLLLGCPPVAEVDINADQQYWYQNGPSEQN
jgi:hypothetical protein